MEPTKGDGPVAQGLEAWSNRVLINGINPKILGVDSFSILFSHLFFVFLTSHFSRVFGGFLERGILGKNGEVTNRKMIPVGPPSR